MNAKTQVIAQSHYDQVDEDGVVTEHDLGQLAIITKSELDQQISTARKWPRSITSFMRQTTELVTLSPEVAKTCIYALPRAGKTIEGASIRFAEVALSCWGNARTATRIVDIGDEFLTVEAMAFDLEKNVAVKCQVMRRITNRKGEKFDSDMIQVTAAAAQSIAMRNAIFRMIPRALWNEQYEAARRVVAGDAKDFSTRRDDMVKGFAILGVHPPQIYGLLGVKGLADITTEHFIMLGGIQTAIKEGRAKAEDAFAEANWPKPTGEDGKPARPTREPEKKAAEVKAEPPKEEPKPEPKAEEKPTETVKITLPDASTLKVGETVIVENKSNATVVVQQSGKQTLTAPASDYEQWYTDQMKALDGVSNLRQLDDLESDVLKELGGDPDRVKEWNAVCGARFKAISAQKAKKK